MIPLHDNIKSKGIAWINYGLIAASTLVYIYQIVLGRSELYIPFTFKYSAIPSSILSSPLYFGHTLITSQFMHGSWLHLTMNMLFLHIFGRSVEARIGHIRYFCFYVLSGIFAAAGQVYLNPTSIIPIVGASGAISGVMGAYLIFYPMARIIFLIPLWIFNKLIEIPAFIFLFGWFVMQILSAVATHGGNRVDGVEMPMVAFWSHSGGFIFGVVYAIFRRVFIKK